MDTVVLQQFRALRARGAIFCDFDGTLSEIVHTPSAARPWPGARETLAALASTYAVVAVVSGRSARELVEWLGRDLEIWGVHGAEMARDGEVELTDVAAKYLPLMQRVIAEARDRVDQLDIPGVLVEDKRVMAGLHFRAATDIEKARLLLDGIAADLAARYGLTRAGGRLAFELRPPVEFSKKQVVLDRAAEMDVAAATFIGDDKVDLPAFDALDELALRDIITWRVAVASDEAPPELIARADEVVDGPSGAIAFLRELL
ncbi:MAG: trehalose-phosphatase [Actinomycetota bacterium]|nr:trehalose-phosphatase [Actinomycetota bacterium]